MFDSEGKKCLLHNLPQRFIGSKRSSLIEFVTCSHIQHNDTPFIFLTHFTLQKTKKETICLHLSPIHHQHTNDIDFCSTNNSTNCCSCWIINNERLFITNHRAVTFSVLLGFELFQKLHKYLSFPNTEILIHIRKNTHAMLRKRQRNIKNGFKRFCSLYAAHLNNAFTALDSSKRHTKRIFT